MNARTKQRGMSLAELMIAMTLGLMLTLGIATLFTQTRQSFGQDEQVAAMQANLRFAMEELIHDITMAGFVGQILNPAILDEDPGLTIGTDCGPAGVTGNWAYNLTNPVEGIANAGPLTASQAFSCLNPTAFRPNTDVIAVKRLATDPITPTDNTVHVTENGTEGCLYTGAAPTNPGVCQVPTGAGAETRRLSVNVYFIRNFSVRADDGIPTLCRHTLQMVSGAPSMSDALDNPECLVEGIEHMYFQYGVDTNSDGVANLYVNQPNAGQLAQLASVRIHLIARSTRAQQRYTNDKTYVLGNRTFAPPAGDSFYRRSASTTVVLRNPTNLRNLGGGPPAGP